MVDLRDKSLQNQNVSAFGIEFLNSVGLAAGFDKNAEWIEPLARVGFGFVEIGSVTLKPQPGNPKPRMYRLPEEEALWNAMGFNSLGLAYVRNQLDAIRCRQSLPKDFRIGVNLGKNKDTALEDAAVEYKKLTKALAVYADYLVVNISSPNTPQLRDLQAADQIERLAESVVSAAQGRPVLFKLAPELSLVELEGIIFAGERAGVSGWIATNTLASPVPAAIRGVAKVTQGGKSGKPLREIAREKLTQIRALSAKPVISVGGIGDSEEMLERLKRGACLTQVYTGWIYQGPRWIEELLKDLRDFNGG